MATNTPLNRIKAIPLWHGEISATPLAGGITNVNYLVTNGGKNTWRVWAKTSSASRHAF